MFKNPRYLTRGVQHDIPVNVQIMLWQLIDKFVVSGTTVDYLQVFVLTAKGTADYPLQHVVHSQEQPDYKMEYVAECRNPVTAKIYCIDDSVQSTMLLAEEY